MESLLPKAINGEVSLEIDEALLFIQKNK